MSNQHQYTSRDGTAGGCESTVATVRNGRVVAAEAQGVWITLEPDAACGSCQTQSICAQRSQRRQFVALDNTRGFAIGSEVELEIRDASLRQAVWLAYGVPLLACLTFTATATHVIPGQETASIAGALFGLALGFALLRTFGRTKSAPTLTVRLRRHD